MKLMMAQAKVLTIRSDYCLASQVLRSYTKQLTALLLFSRHLFLYLCPLGDTHHLEKMPLTGLLCDLCFHLLLVYHFEVAKQQMPK